jgi:hypothetical protein
LAYDGRLGRFLSPDTHQGQVSSPLTLNWNIYAVKNPVNHLDPSGHIAVGTQYAADAGASGPEPEEAIRKLQRDADESLVSKWHFCPDASG